MKLFTLLLLCAAQVGCATTSVQGPIGPPVPSVPTSNTLHLQVGVLQLDETDWEPVDQQGVLGFEFAHEPPSAPLGFEFGLQVSAAYEEEDVPMMGDVDIAASLFEFYGGAHKTFFRDSTVQPYLGAGVTFVAAAFEADFGNLTVSDDDASPGVYVHGGVQVKLADALSVGIDLRTVFGTDIELFGASGDADYGQVAGFFGISF